VAETMLADAAGLLSTYTFKLKMRRVVQKSNCQPLIKKSQIFHQTEKKNDILMMSLL